jgi:hypothetical protein
VSTCPELIKVRASVAPLDFCRYEALHPQGRRLITGWFDRAWEARDCKPEDAFEPFIFTWFAVNGWAACVSGVDQDRAYVEALTCDQSMCKDFARLLSKCGTPFRSHATDFARLWPIFEVKDLRHRGIIRFHGGDRDPIVKGYLEKGCRKLDPLCWKRHSDADEHAPLDWPHTLAALYRVRCNLFHGEKDAHSEMDQRVVSCAFRTLTHFFSAAGYLSR